MGEVEISINEEGALNVVQRYDLRVLLRRLRPEGFERHRVDRGPNCSCVYKSGPDKFNRVLLVLFIIILSFAVINLIMFEQLLTHRGPPNALATWDYVFNQTWLFGHFEIGPVGIILLAMFAAVLAVGVLAKNVPKNAASAPPRRVQEVQTISAPVQQV